MYIVIDLITMECIYLLVFEQIAFTITFPDQLSHKSNVTACFFQYRGLQYNVIHIHITAAPRANILISAFMFESGILHSDTLHSDVRSACLDLVLHCHNDYYMC